jgi:spermidine/putrescine-binding protein
MKKILNVGLALAAIAAVLVITIGTPVSAVNLNSFSNTATLAVVNYSTYSYEGLQLNPYLNTLYPNTIHQTDVGCGVYTMGSWTTWDVKNTQPGAYGDSCTFGSDSPVWSIYNNNQVGTITITMIDYLYWN